MNSGLRQHPSRKYQVTSKIRAICQLAIFGIGAFLISSAHAMKQGHARLISSPGSPLQIVLPIMALSAEDQKDLKVEVAGQSLWSQSGLTLPVPLEALQVITQPGARPDSRTIIVRAGQSSSQAVVDVLLTLSSASGTRQLQVSLLQPAFAQVTPAAGSATIKVQPGDTLYGIAQRNLVPGATIHQMLWALFEANPKAFLSDNMNLLRAGSVLNMPDASTVLAIDPAMARTRFAEHDARFRSLRGKRDGMSGQPPVVGASSASAGKVSQQSQPTAQVQSTEDRLRLSSTEKDRQADFQSSQKREIAEHQARVGELQQNIQQMKDALGQGSGTAAASPSSSASTPGASNALNTQSASPTGATSAAAVGSGTNTVSSQPAQPPSQSSATESGQKEGAVAIHWLKDNLLAVVTALLAFVAFLIGLRMRSHSSRRDDESDDPDAAEQMSPAAKSAFEKKLQAIDLNLDSADASVPDANKPMKS